MKFGKVWGITELIAECAALEFHRLEIRTGGYCSKHRHATKWNGFFLESGRLLIRTWNGELEDVTVLTAGQFSSVAPGYFHQFEALEDCVAFELYWSQYASDDIERVSVGGVRNPSEVTTNG